MLVAYVKNRKFTLKKAAEIITTETKIPHSVNDIFEQAKEGNIQIAIHKPDWEYVRLDEKGKEMEEIYCTPLGVSLVVPVDRMSTGTAPLESKIFYGESELIFPFLRIPEIRNWEYRGKDTFSIYTCGMTAMYEGEKIQVAKVGYQPFPVEGDANYAEFREWLLGYSIVFESNAVKDDLIREPYYFNSNYFFKLDGMYKGRGVEIKNKDLCIVRDELERYIDQCIDQQKKNKMITFQEADKQIKIKTKEKNIHDLKQHQKYTKNQENYYKSLGDKRKRQVDTVERAIKDLGLIKIESGIKPKIHNKCKEIASNRSDFEIVNSSFNTVWQHAKKSGRVRISYSM